MDNKLQTLDKDGSDISNTEESSARSSLSDVIARKLRKFKEMVGRSYGANENTRLLSANGSGSPSESSTSREHESGSGETYEEFFKESAPCPSCRGLGRVPKELENQLVALIPLQDDRLKPRRTMLYVGIAVSVCALAAGLLLFFLMPRNIIISSNRPLLEPTFIFVNSTGSPPEYFANFTVVNHYNVSNKNFYPVKISGVFMKSLYSNAIIAQAMAYKYEPLTLSGRSDGSLAVPINFILKDDYSNLAAHCMSHWTWIHNLPILFEVQANYTYMGHSEQATLTTFQMVSCYPPPKPTTTPAPTTTTITTTTSTTTTTTTTVPTTKPPTNQSLLITEKPSDDPTVDS